MTITTGMIFGEIYVVVDMFNACRFGGIPLIWVIKWQFAGKFWSGRILILVGFLGYFRCGNFFLTLH